MDSQEYTQTSEQALARLMEGNQRFVTGNLSHPHESPEERLALTRGQNPFVALLTCADSRIPPNIVFDQGLGDLFVIRVAGNIVDNVVMGSLEYAAIELHVPLIVVLGHTNCGAVQAAVQGGELPGHLPDIACAIQPAVESVRNKPGDLLDNAIRANAKLVADQLRNDDPALSERVEAGQLRIVAAYYHLATGRIEILQ